MADHPASEGAAVGDAGKPPSKKKLIIIIVAALLLIGGTVGGLIAGGIIKLPGAHKAAAAEGEHGEEVAAEGDKEGEQGAEAEKEAGEGHDAKGGTDAAKGDSAFYEMPDMIVNLTGDNGKQRFLKISITLELKKKSDSKTIEAVLPRVTDHFQTYLRELRLDDLRGSAGLYRLRQELLDRVHSASGVDVKDVLFEEILVQ